MSIFSRGLEIGSDKLRAVKTMLFRQNRGEARTIACGDIKLYIDYEGNTKLYFKDRELCKSRGIDSLILFDGRWHELNGARKIVNKVSENKLLLSADFKDISFIQRWCFELNHDNTLCINVENESKNGLRADMLRVWLSLDKRYENWFNEDALKYEFPGFTQSWQTYYQSERIDFIALNADEPDMPALIFKAQGDADIFFLKNTDITYSSRVFEIRKDKVRELLNPGVSQFFSATIRFCADKRILEDKINSIRQKRQLSMLAQEEEKRRKEKVMMEEEALITKEREAGEEHLRTLNQGDYKLYIDKNNRARIYYKAQEITKWQGLNVGIFSEGVWYSSYDSRLEIERPSEETMVLRFFHNQLPLIQTWDISLNADGLLKWVVRVSLSASVRIDRRNVFLFLSKQYRQWFSDKGEGAFSAFANSEWKAMDNSSDAGGFMGVDSVNELPGVMVKSLSDAGESYLIQNTDLNISSRVFELQREEKKESYLPGEYPFFNIEVRFYADKAELEIMRGSIREKLWRVRLNTDGCEAKDAICLFGDNAYLHDRIKGNKDDFDKTSDEIRSSKGAIKIGISRYNFFRLNEIIQFCSVLIGQRIDLRAATLNLFPLKEIYPNFLKYTEFLRNYILSTRISLYLQDKDLPELLQSISSQSTQYNEKDLLRLLGVITEHSFIGPQTIVVDPYHYCNTNCVHCWIHSPYCDKDPDFLKQKMDLSLYKKLIDDAEKLLCDDIIFQGNGEPFLDDRLFEMAGYARDKGLKVIIFTNGILLDQANIKRLHELEVSEIFCSLPAGMARTYSLINPGHPGDTFDKVVSNLKELISQRRRLKKPSLKLQMTHVIHNMNYQELEAMAKMDADIGADRVRFYLVRLDRNISSLKLACSQIDEIRKALDRIGPYLKSRNIELQDNIDFQLKNYNSQTGDWSQDIISRLGCPVGWFFCMVLAKGEVSMCCHMRIVDYLNNGAFLKIWNSENYNNLRISAKHITRNKEAVFLNGVRLYDDFCKHCDTHQVILRVNELMEKYNLNKFLS